MTTRTQQPTPKHYHVGVEHRGMSCVSPTCWNETHPVAIDVNGGVMYTILDPYLYEIAWRDGANAEAEARREGLTTEQHDVVVTLDSMFHVWEDRSVADTLAVATRIFSTDLTWWQRLKVAWRVLV